MQDRNLSLEVEFLSAKLKDNNSNAFGALADNDQLAILPETTGVVMQVDGLISHSMVSRRDISMLRKAQEPLYSERQNKSSDNLIRETAIDDFENEITEVGIDENGFLSEGAAAAFHDMNLSFELIVGHTSEILPIWFLEAGVARSRSVCKLETSGIDYKGRSGSWRGTGFLIGESILLTNHHVLNSKNVCENAVCTFNYQIDELGKMQKTESFQLNPSRLFLTSGANDLDFTVCWVEGNPGRNFGYIPVSRHAFTVKMGDCANIIQHPNGDPKSVVVQENKVTNQDEVVVRYSSDTLPGSSGAIVASNEWKLFALHHASREVKSVDISVDPPTPAQYINEGIKLSAIATYLETLTGPNDKSLAAEVLELFGGTDAMLGYFGGLGRSSSSESLPSTTGFERVVDTYRGESRDIDIAFWNIEWFNKNYRTKLESVAQIIVKMNLDIWIFEESSPQAAEALVDYLKHRYKLEFDFSASEPQAPSAKQTTTVIWNTKTVNIERIEWPENIKNWFSLRSDGFSSADDLNLESDATLLFESVDGKIFDRFPGLFQFKSSQPSQTPIDGFIVPLHLKAMGEGKKRRQMASRILSIAVQTMIDQHGADSDWILGGDLNATLASGDLNFLSDGKFTAISAKDEGDKAITYIKGRFKSLIDHVFLSPNLSKTVGSDDFFIVAHDKVLPDYLSISDHRPVLVRLSMGEQPVRESSSDINELSYVDPQLAIKLSRLAKRELLISNQRGDDFGDEESLEDNLALVLENQERDYYNEDDDKGLREAYYGQIPTGLNGKQLFEHFSALVSKTHSKILSYKPSKYLYPWVDLQPDRKIRNVYSGEVSTPEELIEADFKTKIFIRQRINENSTLLEASLEHDSMKILQQLESDFPFNCEHVVPQSWFGEANPMKGDLHHLFSCTPKCNSFRGNTPYFEFPNWEEKVMDECGLSEAGGFEPKEGKGAVARATLYFLLRYPGKTNRYKLEQIVAMIVWHVSEPPSTYEKHRNMAIHELQGNRNPFIDYPQLANKIDFIGLVSS